MENLTNIWVIGWDELLESVLALLCVVGLGFSLVKVLISSSLSKTMAYLMMMFALFYVAGQMTFPLEKYLGDWSVLCLILSLIFGVYLGIKLNFKK